MKKIVFVVCLVCSAFAAFSQSENYKRCGTDEMWRQAVLNNPDIAVRHDRYTAFARHFKSSEYRVKSGNTIQYTIPVVVHIMHAYGPENISKAQVLDGIDILNKSFQKLNPDTGTVIPFFQPIFANCEIQFRLANIDPNGNCTDGITRTYTPLTYSAGDNVKALIDWPNDQYFNIWVVHTIASGAAGYAYYPGITGSIDGVVILHDYIGSIGTSNGSNYSSRSLTHEVGHYLNLPHTWGSTNNPGVASNCGIDDGIDDTPNTLGVADFSCNTNQNTCGPVVPGNLDSVDNVQNYMDYAGCHYMFTNGQKDAMHSALNTFFERSNLWDPANLLATGTEDGHIQQACNPTADFNINQYYSCTGTNVTFKDLSYGGNIVSRQWSFPGGTPSTDTSANPLVSYSSPGSYNVTLTVNGPSGSNSLSKNNIVVVNPAVSTLLSPISEGFETISLPGNGWQVINPDNNNAWGISGAAASTGTKSARLININNNPAGSIDAFVSPAFNISNASAVQCNFKIAYASRSSSDASYLKVFFSTDCGKTWKLRLQRTGTSLPTVSAPLTSNFIPLTTQWRSETISLASQLFAGASSIMVKFEFTNDQGNNIYIDDINIAGTTGLATLNAADYELNIFPNPAQHEVKIKLNRPVAESVHWELYDISGRLMDRSETASEQVGLYEAAIPNREYSGVYLLKIITGNTALENRIVFIGK